jgi:hypothetical protein
MRCDHTWKGQDPTLAWNVCVAHNTKILNVYGHKRDVSASQKEWVRAFKEAINDKTIVRTER